MVPFWHEFRSNYPPPALVIMPTFTPRVNVPAFFSLTMESSKAGADEKDPGKLSGYIDPKHNLTMRGQVVARLDAPLAHPLVRREKLVAAALGDASMPQRAWLAREPCDGSVESLARSIATKIGVPGALRGSRKGHRSGLAWAQTERACRTEPGGCRWCVPAVRFPLGRSSWIHASRAVGVARACAGRDAPQ